ncbi:dihydrofolate reductase family protein [Bowdeniella nasicola]|uniref:dihydrofolate reductase family protein n=1 Tax=Bowdeniella nasicola TaxID=208480 RepID=UPI003965C7B9
MQLLRGDVEQAVRDLKEQPGGLLIVGGARLPQSLAKWGLIDEYEFVIHPIVAGHGPRLLTGLPNSSVSSSSGVVPLPPAPSLRSTDRRQRSGG